MFPGALLMFFYVLLGVAFSSVNAIELFIDDLGFRHQCVENPKVVMSAQMAVSMHHLGMPDEMLIASYGLPFGRASKGLAPGVTSQYETDAQLDDVTWLRSFPTLSPECWEGYRTMDWRANCGSLGNGAINFTALEKLEVKPNFIAESPRFFSTVVANNATTHENGADLIYIDSMFEGGEDCRPDRTKADAGQNISECFSRSSIKTMERYEELAKCWGFEISAQAKEKRKIVRCI